MGKLGRGADKIVMRAESRLAQDMTLDQFAKFILYISEEDLQLSEELFSEASSRCISIADLFAALLWTEVRRLRANGLLKFMYADRVGVLSDSVCGTINWQRSISRNTLEYDCIYVNRNKLTLHNDLHYILSVGFSLALHLCSEHSEFITALRKDILDADGLFFGFSVERSVLDDRQVRILLPRIDSYLNSRYFSEYVPSLVICRLLLLAFQRSLGGTLDSFVLDNALEYILQQYVISGIRKELRRRMYGLGKLGYHWSLRDSDRAIYKPDSSDGYCSSLYADGVLRISCPDRSQSDALRWLLDVKTNKVSGCPRCYPFQENVAQMVLYLSANNLRIDKGILFHITFGLAPSAAAGAFPRQVSVLSSGISVTGFCINFARTDDIFEVSKAKFKEFCDWLQIPAGGY